MLNVKSNYKKGNDNLMCRMFNNSEETQEHILCHCPALHQNNENRIDYENIFQDDNMTALAETAKKIRTLIDKLQTD